VKISLALLQLFLLGSSFELRNISLEKLQRTKIILAIGPLLRLLVLFGIKPLSNNIYRYLDCSTKHMVLSFSNGVVVEKWL
jgi:hypothetical protein